MVVGMREYISDKNQYQTEHSRGEITINKKWLTIVKYLSLFHIDVEMIGHAHLNKDSTIPPFFQKLPLTLVTGNFFDGDIPQLPPTLKYIDLAAYNQSFLSPLPESLVYLKLGSYNGPLPEPLPANLQVLDLGAYTGKMNTLPESLTELQLFRFNKILTKFPDRLKKLVLISYTHKLPALPQSLDTLILGKYNRPGPLNLPMSLKTLDMYSFDQPLPNLPDSILELRLGSFNHKLLHIPSECRLLSITAYTHDIPPLPDSLTALRVGHIPNDWNNLPQSLQELSISNIRQPQTVDEKKKYVLSRAMLPELHIIKLPKKLRKLNIRDYSNKGQNFVMLRMEQDRNFIVYETKDDGGLISSIKILRLPPGLTNLRINGRHMLENKNRNKKKRHYFLTR